MSRRPPHLSASILNADFSRLGEEVERATAGGVDSIHLDVMDGRFVDNISFGAPVVAAEYFESLPSEGDLKWAIGDLLDREINPAVAQHGGWVELIDVRKNNVYLRLGGGCLAKRAREVRKSAHRREPSQLVRPAVGAGSRKRAHDSAAMGLAGR